MGGVATALAGLGYTEGSLAPFTNGVEQFGESLQISTIKKFGDELNQAQQQQWDKTQNDIRAFDASYQAIYGKSVFTDAYQNDLKKFNESIESSHQGVPKVTTVDWEGPFGVKVKMPKVIYTPTNEQQDLFFYMELQKGEDYIFQREGRTDMDNRNTSLGRGLDDIQTDFKVGVEISNALAQERWIEQSFIDPNITYGYPQDVPHTEENATRINQFQQGESQGIWDKLLIFLQNHPDKFNSATVTRAIQNEEAFMKSVQADWNFDSINRSVREGDYIGAVDQAVKDGVKTIEKAGEDIINDATDPLKIFYDLLNDLWASSGTYIEMIIAFVIVVVLLYVAGQIKYVTT